MSNVAYLSLGSNLGNREGTLREAVRRLGALGRVISISSLYETEPVEFTDQPWFLNCAVALEADEAPQRLMAELLQIERDMGRERLLKKGPRTIDVDILLYGDVIVQSAELTLPHPAMHQRRFVLEPLAEIAPEARHPILKKTTRELLDELPAGPAIRRVLANDQRPTANDSSTVR